MLNRLSGMFLHKYKTGFYSQTACVHAKRKKYFIEINYQKNFVLENIPPSSG